MAKKKTVPSKQAQWVPLKYNIPDNLITRFATNMVVQIIETEFKISFFEQSPPIRLNTSQPPPKEVLSNCVASVIVSADRLPNFIKVLQRQLDQYNTAKKT